MAFWLWAVSSVLVVIGVLLIAPTSIDGTVLYQSYFGVVFAVLGLFFGGLGIVVCRPNAAFYRTKPIIVTVCFLLSVGCFGLRAYQQQASHIRTAAPIINAAAPVMVTAKVRLFELSDSIYNPALGLPYRQKAILTDIRPYDVPSDTSNPFGFEATVTSSTAPLPDVLTVLLQAYPYTPSKNRPTDPLMGLSQLKVGDEVSMTLRLSPILPNQNQGGFDGYKWLLTRHIHAKADIVTLDGIPTSMTNLGVMDGFGVGMERFREYYRTIFYDKFQQDLNASTAITLSLLTGDRALIDKPTKELYQYGGISHLLAISGTHVLFLAMVLANLAVFVVNRKPSIYRHIPRWQLRFGVMVLAAVLYAVFTGFEVPAVRTVFMLIFVGLVRLLLFRVSVFISLMTVGLIMIALDPVVVWQAGFWLSFVAVALLMSYENNNKNNSLSEILIELIKLQTYIFVAMLPISLLLFGKVSLLGLVVNLFAVGLFGYVIVPLNLLAGVAQLVIPSLANGLWMLSIMVLDVMHGLLGALSLTVGRTWLHTPMSVAVVLLFGLVLWVWRMRLIPKIFVVLPLFVVVCALAMPVAPSATSLAGNTIIQLNPSSSVRQILIQNNSQVWLILSTHAKGHTLKDEKLAEEILDALHKHNIDRLSGVLIQDDNMMLAKVAGRISLDMPTHRLLWAGESISVGNLVAAQCKAQMTIGLDKMNLHILTGWQDIPDQAMHTCNIAITADTPISIKTKDEQMANSILINASQDDRIWQVYHLMCANQGEKALQPTIMISQAMPEDILAKFGNPSVVNTLD